MASSLPLFNTFYVWKILQSIKFYMRTSARWVVNLFQSFEFIKAKVDKHISSSTLPTIYTMANSSNFTYFGKLEESTQDAITRHHILVKGFKSKGGAIHIVAFDFIVSLNMLC
jgi:hypothetical protein